MTKTIRTIILAWATILWMSASALATDSQALYDEVLSILDKAPRPIVLTPEQAERIKLNTKALLDAAQRAEQSNTAAPVPSPTQADSRPGPAPAASPRRAAEAPAGRSLAAIVRDMQPGWRDIPQTSIAPHLPTQGETEWGVTGPHSVIGAWNGAAYDAISEEWYFHGGGHANYGGNEVYRFSFRDLTWKRLTQPSKYPARVHDRNAPAEQRCPYPVEGPAATHTYNGKVMSEKTRTMFLMTTAIAYCTSGLGERGGDNALWEFNPSEKETRNALAPLKWRRHQSVNLTAGFPRMVELTDGNIAIGANTYDAILDPVTPAISQRHGGYGNDGEGSNAYDRKRETVWALMRGGLYRIDYRNGKLAGRQLVTRQLPSGLSYTSGMALHEPSGKLVFWRAGRDTLTYDPDTKRWELHEHSTGPSSKDSTVFNKWIYLPKYDVFAGYQNSSGNVYLYRLPTTGGVDLNSQPILQKLIDAAPAGSTLVLPQGSFRQAIRISKAGTIRGDGTSLSTQTVSGKGAIEVTGDNVTIENIAVSDIDGASNLAAIRLEAPNLVVRKLRSMRVQTHMLSGNIKSGIVEVYDSLLQDATGSAGDYGQTHGIYLGPHDKVIFSRTDVRRVDHGGHTFKSRAKSGVVEYGIFSQEGHDGSRSFDLSNGGNWILRHIVIQHGNKGNSDIIGFAREGDPGDGRTHSLLIENSVIINDRPGKAQVVSLKPGMTVPVKIVNSVLVGVDLPAEMDGGGNKVFTTRRAAGLPDYPAVPSIKR